MTELDAIIGADISNNTANLDGSQLPNLGPDVFHHAANPDGSPLPDLGPDVYDHVANLVGLPLPDSDAAANQVADISDHAANQVGATFLDIGAAANQVADILDHAVHSTLLEIHNIADNGDIVIANMWSDITYLAANTTTGRCIFKGQHRSGFCKFGSKTYIELFTYLCRQIIKLALYTHLNSAKKNIFLQKSVLWHAPSF